MNKYTAKFSNGETAERKFAKPLTHAYLITYRVASDENAKPVSKIAFAQSHAGAEKAIAGLPKRVKLLSSEIVATQDAGKVEQKGKAKSAKAKPAFVKGDLVALTLGEGEAVVVGKLAKLGTKNAYVTLAGALTDIKVNASAIRKVDPSAPVDAPALAEAA